MCGRPHGVACPQSPIWRAPRARLFNGFILKTHTIKSATYGAISRDDKEILQKVEMVELTVCSIS